MPVVGIPIDMLMRRIETDLDRDALVQHLQHLGCDMEGFAAMRRFRCERCENLMEITETENPPVLCDRCAADFKENKELLTPLGTTDVIRMELLPVRPDMFDPGGLARVLRNYLGETDQPARYELGEPWATVTVDPAVQSDVCPRAFIACAVVRGVTLSDDRIKVIMKLQENLHWAMGRDRKHASIGVYDLDTVSGPDFAYRSVGRDELRFCPLGVDPADEAGYMTPAEVLEKHPKGIGYARLLNNFERFPWLCDSEGAVLSMPPIINSEQTRVRGDSKNFFIDVTGTDERLVNKTLNVLVTSLMELDRGAKLEQVKVAYPERTVVTPDLTPQQVELDAAWANRSVGVGLDTAGVDAHLRKMGHDVQKLENNQLLVSVPAYRNDIMHPVDLVEDVAIAYGYHNITPALVPTMTVGDEQPRETHKNVARRVLAGMGYLEVMTLLLSSEEADYDALQRPRRDDHVRIENPISVEQTQIRTTILPGLLDTLSINTNHELPQKIFEVGNISLLSAEAETGAAEHARLATAAIGPKIDYATVRSLADAILREFGWQLEANPDPCATFIPGRGAAVYAIKRDRREPIGLMGEVHPGVLANYKLVQPTILLELDLDLLAR